MAAMVATGANAQKLPPDGRGTPKTMVPGGPPTSMDDIAEGARRVLNHIENNSTEDRYVTGYIRAVRQYALNAQRGDGMEMAKVLETLAEINADTKRLNQRIETVEKTTSTLSTSLSTLPADSAAAWRAFRAKDWQRGLAQAETPNLRSYGTSPPGVPEIELREDRELIVKVGPNRAQVRALSPKELVERTERQKATVTRQKNSTALAGGASFVAARKLPSGDVVMIANSAAGAETLRRHTEWLRAFGPGSIVQEPSWGVVAYNVPVKSMKLTPETMTNVAAELLAQNNWGEAARIQYVGWLKRPGARAEGSVLIEFTSPIVANHAIVTGVVYADSSTYHRVPLHFRHTVDGSKAAPPTTGLGISMPAPERQAEDESPQQPQPVAIDLEAEPHAMGAPAKQHIELTKTRRGPGRPKGSRAKPKDQGPQPRDNVAPTANQRSTRSQAASQKAAQEHTISKKRRVGEPEDTMDEQPDDSNWLDIRLPQAEPSQDHPQQDRSEIELTQFTNEVTTINDTNSPEPSLQNLDPDSPEYRKLITLKYNRPQSVPVRSSPPVFMTDAPTIEDQNDEIWHETSEHSDNEQTHQ
ncbi:hypothetical protein E8E15_001207 [Penicillium rubens]|nr:hypothetical protein E8E15_001207 [Penicillium rubens]